MKQKSEENQYVLKNLIQSKEKIKKTEEETNKVLDFMTVKRTDDWLKKSTDDYKDLVQRKDRRN